MFENTRFEDIDGRKKYKNNCPVNSIGKYWATLGDVFVNDAFGTAPVLMLQTLEFLLT